jgi:hypothetical protein
MTDKDNSTKETSKDDAVRRKLLGMQQERQRLALEQEHL